MNDKYKRTHLESVSSPRTGFESAVVRLLTGLVQYSEAHRAAYNGEIGEDYVLGPCFADVANGLLGLLNGETGRLDCGDLDGTIRFLCRVSKVEGVEQ